MAYIRFFVWNALGVGIYFFYGAVHSAPHDAPQVGAIGLVPMGGGGGRRTSESAGLLGGARDSSSAPVT